MIVTALSQELISQVRRLMELGAPYVRVRTDSDYWLYARLFSSSCPVALVDNTVVGVVIAFRSQDKPDDLYVQDVMTHPEHRNRSIARTLLEAVRQRAAEWGCIRLYLTSEPENAAAHATWTSMGFVNLPGDHMVTGISVTTDFKGPGKDRALYELSLSDRDQERRQVKGGRTFREAWIDGVRKHYPGEPKQSYFASWDETPDWERSSATAVHDQVRAFVRATDGRTDQLSRAQKGRFVALCWIGQIFKHFPDPKPAYVADWDELPQWQQETDADIFERIEQESQAPRDHQPPQP